MRQLQSLPLFHRIKGQRVLVLGEGSAAEPKRRLVERAGGIVIEDMARAVDEGVRLAFVAYDDAKACEVAAINLRCAGILVNVVDKPDLCDFTTPSILDRNPVLIAIGTGGASAGLAKHVRLRLERLLPESLGMLAQALFGIRGVLRRSYPDATDRRRALDEALREGGALDALAPDSHAKVGEWAEGGAGEIARKTIEFTISSDDPEDLTLKQARMLGEADVVCAIGTMSPAILARARADAARISCNQHSCSYALAKEADDATSTCPIAAQQHPESRLTVILRSAITP